MDIILDNPEFCLKIWLRWFPALFLDHLSYYFFLIGKKMRGKKIPNQPPQLPSMADLWDLEGGDSFMEHTAWAALSCSALSSLSCWDSCRFRAMASAANRVRSFVLLFLSRERKGGSSVNPGTSPTCPHSSICFQACLFLLPIHWYSRQNDQLIFASILTQRISNTWQKHSGILETGTVQLLLLARTSDVNPGSHLRCHP